MGAFRSLWQPWVFSQTRGPCSPTPSLSPPLSLLGPLGPSWDLRNPWEPSEAFGSLGSLDSGALLPLTPSLPPLSLSPLSVSPLSPLSLSPCSPTPFFPLPPEPSWAPGTFLGPQESLGAFRSLWQPWVFRLRGLAPPHLPLSLSPLSVSPLSPLSLLSPPSLSPLSPKHSITYPYPPLAIGSEGGVRGARWERDGARWEQGEQTGDSLACFLLLTSLPLAPSHSPTSHLVKLSLPDIYYSLLGLSG